MYFQKVIKHFRKHSKIGSVPSLKYKCSTCSKLFGTLSKVRSHMEVHNCNNDDLESNSVRLNIPLKQPMMETEEGKIYPINAFIAVIDISYFAWIY